MCHVLRKNIISLQFFEVKIFGDIVFEWFLNDFLSFFGSFLSSCSKFVKRHVTVTLSGLRVLNSVVIFVFLIEMCPFFMKKHNFSSNFCSKDIRWHRFWMIFECFVLFFGSFLSSCSKFVKTHVTVTLWGFRVLNSVAFFVFLIVICSFFSEKT